MNQPSVHMPRPQVTERTITGGPGLPLLVLFIILIPVSMALLINGIFRLDGMRGFLPGLELAAGLWQLITGVVLLALASTAFAGITLVAPNEARVIQLFGRYRGTIRRDGMRWVNPFTTRQKISTRVRNHETSVMKVNDSDGNPIEIAAVVVWQVQDTARAVFEVDSYVDFVTIQTETAVRFIANHYPYDAFGEGEVSLRDSSEVITGQLEREISARVEAAGVRIIESRITHLAYAQEIAQAMLQRQQAGAVVAARTQIVEGAVGMVNLALTRLKEQGVVELDEERKATMVSNLLVVLCADRSTQPVINTGTLYQ